MRDVRSIDEPFEPSCEQKEIPHTILRYYLFEKTKGEIGIESVPCWSNQKLSEIKLAGTEISVQETDGFVQWVSGAAVGNDSIGGSWKRTSREPISQPHRNMLW